MKALLVITVLLLTACGQAGPLVLPDQAPPQKEEPKKKDPP